MTQKEEIKKIIECLDLMTKRLKKIKKEVDRRIQPDIMGF